MPDYRLPVYFIDDQGKLVTGLEGEKAREIAMK